MKERIKICEERLCRLLSGCKRVPNDLNIYCFDVTESTNLDARAEARTAISDGVFIAERQTAGRGRLGRSFLSDSGGLYMSLLFKRKMLPEDALKITVAAAVSVRRAVKSLAGIDTGIKWVNDIFIGGKKLAGILCEGACDEFGQITHVVLGIGLNIAALKCDELADIATSLSEHSSATPTREALAAEIIKEIYGLSEEGFDSVLDEYRRASCVIGKHVRVIKLNEEFAARAIGIDSAGALIIEKEDGSHEALATGEVSVRL